MREVQAWIDRRLDETMTIEQIAEHFALSRSVLTREFRRHTGKSLIEYCNARRIENAAAMLAANRNSIVQVALASGFANLSHFHRQFKAIYGVSPAAFRRQLAGTIETA